MRATAAEIADSIRDQGFKNPGCDPTDVGETTDWWLDLFVDDDYILGALVAVGESSSRWVQREHLFLAYLPQEGVSFTWAGDSVVWPASGWRWKRAARTRFLDWYEKTVREWETG